MARPSLTTQIAVYAGPLLGQLAELSVPVRRSCIGRLGHVLAEAVVLFALLLSACRPHAPDGYLTTHCEDSGDVCPEPLVCGSDPPSAAKFCTITCEDDVDCPIRPEGRITACEDGVCTEAEPND